MSLFASFLSPRNVQAKLRAHLYHNQQKRKEKPSVASFFGINASLVDGFFLIEVVEDSLDPITVVNVDGSLFVSEDGV